LCIINVPAKMTKAAGCARQNFQEKRANVYEESAKMKGEIEMHFLGIVSRKYTHK
jgi:hypothetical protein